MSQKVLIVGGVAGGATAAARLRRLDENATIIMFEKGDYISYANCGLPYYIGDVIKDKEKLTLQTPQTFHQRFQVDVRIGSEVTAIDRVAKSVTVKVKDGTTYDESYDKLVLSPGAEPFVPNVEGASNPNVFTLRSVPDTFRIKNFCQVAKPKSAVVVGAGYIGIEMAENLHALGIQVSIVEMADHAVGPFDFDMACELHGHIQSKGVELILNKALRDIKIINGQTVVVLEDSTHIPADLVIMSIGVRPETSLAKTAGLALNARGSIIVDEYMRTSDPNIYAVGDAIEVKDFNTGKPAFLPLAGPANKQGRIAADNICGRDSRYQGTQGSAILKCFDMTAAITGMNERQAIAEGINYEKSFTFSGSHASYFPGSTFMSIKLLYNKDDGKVLGAQITGYDGVDKRCDVIATAIRASMTVNQMADLELCYAPPFSAAKDPVNMAAYVAQNLLTKDSALFHWHDIEKLDLDKVTLLDTRTAEEFKNGTISGAVLFPVDEIRTRLDEIDKSKPVYVFCRIGLRGYVTCRILTQHGFTAYNLSGGYRLWETIFAQRPVPKSNTFAQAIKEEHLQDLSEKSLAMESKTIQLDACGLQCPGPILKVYAAVNAMSEGDIVEVTATDPAFAVDIQAWCKRTGNVLLDSKQNAGIFTVTVQKGTPQDATNCASGHCDKKNIIVFSGDLDKAIASFIIANGAAAMGRKVQMFFTFWGINMLRKSTHVKVKKNLIEKMFGFMMPRGSKKLSLSKMNMAGMGAAMIRGIMKHKNIDSLESLITLALDNGVELVACTMTMDIMGIKKEELLDRVQFGGVASMLANAEESDMSLFI
ncbi:MAG: DsrE/DsrF/DrsH-like family protein [Clostridia bacterium]